MSLLLTDNASPGSSDGMMPGFPVEEVRGHLALSWPLLGPLVVYNDVLINSVLRYLMCQVHYKIYEQNQFVCFVFDTSLGLQRHTYRTSQLPLITSISTRDLASTGAR